MRQRAWRVLLAVLIALLPRAGRAAEPSPPEHCKTPRAAVESVFGWLTPEHHNPTKAARCLDRVGRSSSEVRELALAIKAVYEARALEVEPEAFSDEPGWVNPDTKQPAFAPHRSLPEVVVERQADGQWRWSRASLAAIEELHDGSGLGSKLVKRLPPWLRTKGFGLQLWQLLALIGLLIVGLLLRQLIRFLVKRRLASFAERRGRQLAADVVQVFATPGAALLGAALLAMAYPELGLPLGVAVAMSTTVRLLVLFGVVLALYRLVDVLSTHLTAQGAADESRLDNHFVPLIRKALKVVILCVGLLILLQNLEVNVVSLLAGLGIGGLAVALAAKDSIANFFGSIMIFADRPFRVGDWILVEGAEGKIEEVGFRSTRIRTLADSLVTLPNAKFMEAKIENFGARRHRRIQATLGVTYDTDVARLEELTRAIRELIAAEPSARQDDVEVHLGAFGAHSLDIMVHFYVTASTWTEELEIRHRVFLEIIRAAEKLGVRFAFPTRTLHVESLPEAVSKGEEPR